MPLYSRVACIVKLLLLLIAWPLAAVAEHQSEDTGPGSEFKHSDRFFSDSTKNYNFVGDVRWETGLLELPPASAVVYRENLLAKFDFEAHLWPLKGDNPQQTSSSRLVFLFSNGYRVDLIIARQKLQGRLLRQVVVVESSRGGGQQTNRKSKTQQLRHFSAFSMKGDVERWKVTYRNGIVHISCNNRDVGTTYSGAFASWFNAVAIQQDKGSSEVSQFSLTGTRSGYTAEERTAYQKSNELRREAERLLASGDLDGAIETELLRIPLIEENLTRDAYASALAYQWLADRYSTARYAEKERKALESTYLVFRKTIGSSHPETLVSQSQTIYAEAQAKAKELDDAIREMGGVLQKMLSIAGRRSEKTFTVANRLSALLAAQAAKQIEKGDHISYVDTASNMVKLAELTRQPDDWYLLSLRRGYENAKVHARAIKQGDQRTLKWFEDVEKASQLIEAGQEAAALELQKKLLEEARELFGNDHTLTASNLSALSITASNCGDAGLSILCAEKNLKYWRKHAEQHDPDLALALMRLGASYSMSNRFQEAEELFVEAAAIYAEAHETESDTYATFLLEKARNLIRSGDYSAARPLLEESLKIHSLGGDAASGPALTTRERLANLCRVEGDIEAAEFYMQQQRALVERAYGPNSAPYFELLISEATNLLERKEFEEAATRYREAIKLIEKGYGKQSRLYQAASQGLATALAWQGDNNLAAQSYLNLVDMQQRKQESLYAIYPESMQFGTSLLDRHMLVVVVQLALDGKIEPAQAYQRILRTKGAVTVRQRRFRQASRTPELRKLVKRLAETNSKLANKLIQPSTNELQEEIQTLYTHKQSLEAELATKTSAQKQDSFDVDVERLRACIPPNTALVDYFEYHRQPNYIQRLLGLELVPALVAFVTTPNREVEIFDLGESVPIFQALADWTLAMRQERFLVAVPEYNAIVDEVDMRGAKLRKLIWTPIRKRVAFADTIVVSPDGILTACPFAALPTASRARYLIEEHALVSTVAMSSLPEFLEQGPREVSEGPGLLVVEHVNYGKIQGDSKEGTDEKPLLFQPLLAEEAEHLSKSFSTAFPDGKVEKLTDADATEDVVKEAMPHCKFIHLSTHGFCLHASQVQLMSVEVSELQEMLGSLKFDPVVSGVALASANNGILGESEPDGILWANEIASLDLDRAELVVLSACETLVGSYASGEGLLGCQRALYVAGANSALATRWAIEDEATSVFMAHFYSNLWEKKMTKAEALQTAMKFMIRKYPLEQYGDARESVQIRRPPALWAGFVLTGDWR